MAIVLKTYGERLAEVQEAISVVLTNQSYKLGGREYVRADLEFLQKEEQRMQDKLDKFGDVYPNMTARTGQAYGVSFG